MDEALMKILHLPGSFMPTHHGGKEVFVHQLIKTYPDTSVIHLVAVEGDDAVTSEYNFDGIRVIVLPKASSANSAKSYFTGEYSQIPGFENLLDSEQPDLVHFHDQGTGASMSHLRICKSKNIKTLVTYHSPGQSCPQRAMLFKGRERCNGKLIPQRCTQCRSVVSGYPDLLAKATSNISLSIDTKGKYLKRVSTDWYIDGWKEFYATIDAVQVHALWVKDMLVSNGVEEGKIYFTTLGGHHEKLPFKEKKNGLPLQVVFIGRCADIKGIHLLIEAVKQIDKETIKVHFFSGGWDASSYGQAQLAKIAGDKRFEAPKFVPQSELQAHLSQMDVCVIPSLWPETGPFTLFDANAANVPVLVANWAGLSERVVEDKNGWCFEWGSASDLKTKLEYLVVAKQQKGQLDDEIKAVSMFSDTTAQIATIYNQIIFNTK